MSTTHGVIGVPWPGSVWFSSAPLSSTPVHTELVGLGYADLPAAGALGRGQLTGFTRMGTPPVDGPAFITVFDSSDLMWVVARKLNVEGGEFVIRNLKAGRYRVVVSNANTHFPRMFLVDVTEP